MKQNMRAQKELALQNARAEGAGLVELGMLRLAFEYLDAARAALQGDAAHTSQEKSE